MMPADENTPADRELVLGEKKPFDIPTNKSQQLPTSEVNESTDFKKSESIELNNEIINDLDITNSKEVVADSSLQVSDTEQQKITDLKKSEIENVGAIKNKKSNTEKIKEVDTSIKSKVNNSRLLPNKILPTRKKKQVDTDENAKQKHLPPGRAHLTGNIEKDLHSRMKIFALLNSILLMDVAEAGMSVYMDILDIPNVEYIVKDGQTITEAILDIVKAAVKKKTPV